MSRKYRILIFTLFLVLTSTSQPVITDSIIPSYEDQLFYERLFFTSTFYQTPSGPNVQWDFSNISLKQERYHQWWTDPLFKEGHNYYPSSNIFVNGFVRGGLFYIYDSNGLYKVGSYQDSTTYLSFEDDPELTIPIPITYGDSYLDTFSGVYINAADTFNLSGTNSISADGYGTLILKNGIYYNVLRVYYDQYLAWYNNGQLIMEEFIKEYRWYKNSYKNYLLSHYHIVIDDPVLGNLIDEIDGYYLDSLLVSVDEIGINNSNIEIYPIPTYGQVNVNLVDFNIPTYIELYDASGALQLVKSGQRNSIVTINITGKTGFYLIKISDTKGKYIVRRIIKL